MILFRVCILLYYFKLSAGIGATYLLGETVGAVSGHGKFLFLLEIVKLVVVH